MLNKRKKKTNVTQLYYFFIYLFRISLKAKIVFLTDKASYPPPVKLFHSLQVFLCFIGFTDFGLLYQSRNILFRGLKILFVVLYCVIFQQSLV